MARITTESFTVHYTRVTVEVDDDRPSLPPTRAGEVYDTTAEPIQERPALRPLAKTKPRVAARRAV